LKAIRPPALPGAREGADSRIFALHDLKYLLNILASHIFTQTVMSMTTLAANARADGTTSRPMSGLSSPENWFAFKQKSSAQAPLRLFCFPYAGGSAVIYRAWPDELSSSVEVCPVLLPGRGGRLGETPYEHLEPLLDSLKDAILPYLDRPFAFFGHSMGAMIAFELARRLRREHGIEPIHLFVSGRRAPQVSDPSAPTHNLPQEEFLEELRRLDGTPREVLENQELLSLVLPVVRADFSIVENYLYTPERPLDCPISAFGGLEDQDVTRENIEAWRHQTVSSFSLRMLPGGHFFLNSAQPLLLRMLSQDIYRIVRKLS
jgi:medium-chain acyl-[acyl-carrier-protein] hydrolase